MHAPVRRGRRRFLLGGGWNDPAYAFVDVAAQSPWDRSQTNGLRLVTYLGTSPNLEKALTYLDDSLLGSTSNAVERSNRRHRKMQKTVYRVRTQPTISGRIALDMFREAQGPSREQTMMALRHTRRR